MFLQSESVNVCRGNNISNPLDNFPFWGKEHVWWWSKCYGLVGNAIEISTKSKSRVLEHKIRLINNKLNNSMDNLSYWLYTQMWWVVNIRVTLVKTYSHVSIKYNSPIVECFDLSWHILLVIFGEHFVLTSWPLIGHLSQSRILIGCCHQTTGTGNLDLRHLFWWLGSEIII